MSGRADWCDLKAELDRWGLEGRVASFWWRDDDAVSVTPPLARAIDLSRRYRVPLHLAVIPSRIESSLGEALAGEASIEVLQHGYAHTPGELKRRRPAEVVLAEMSAGHEILDRTLHQRFLPVMVAPWNLIRGEFIPLIAQAGLHALSTSGNRTSRFAEGGVEVLNIHFGPLSWDGGRPHFMGNSAALGELIAHLQARRTGAADPDEPTGLSTHHLEHDEESWVFTERALAEISDHEAARWFNLREIMHQVST